MNSNAKKLSMENPIVNELLEQIPSESWLGIVSEEQATAILSGKKVGTYFFREGTNGSIYLSGVNSQGEVSHNRFLKNDLVWLGLNHGPYLRKSAAELISLCLHCVDEECSPLKA